MTRYNSFSASRNRSWFWWGINIGVAIAVFVWWWLENQEKPAFKKYPKKERSLILTDDPPLDTPPKKAAPLKMKPTKKDDLKKIEGIGPRSAQALAEAGIISFSQLAEMTPDAVKETLKAAGVRIGSPDTWPEQAALAASEKWDELKELQNSLQGGRRVG